MIRKIQPSLAKPRQEISHELSTDKVINHQNNFPTAMMDFLSLENLKSITDVFLKVTLQRKER